MKNFLVQKIFESEVLKFRFKEVYFDLKERNYAQSNSILFYKLNLSSFAQVNDLLKIITN